MKTEKEKIIENNIVYCTHQLGSDCQTEGYYVSVRTNEQKLFSHNIFEHFYFGKITLSRQ